jgi:hypothetical protein
MSLVPKIKIPVHCAYNYAHAYHEHGLTNHDHGLANNVHGLETMTYASLSWFETNIAGKCNCFSGTVSECDL